MTVFSIIWFKVSFSKLLNFGNIVFVATISSAISLTLSISPSSVFCAKTGALFCAFSKATLASTFYGGIKHCALYTCDYPRILPLSNNPTFWLLSHPIFSCRTSVCWDGDKTVFFINRINHPYSANVRFSL